MTHVEREVDCHITSFSRSKRRGGIALKHHSLSRSIRPLDLSRREGGGRTTDWNSTPSIGALRSSAGGNLRLGVLASFDG